MKASCCGCPDGTPSDGDGTTLARAAARFREQQPNSPSISATQAQMPPTRNIIPTKKSEFGAGITLSGAADSAEGMYDLCDAGPGASRLFRKEPPPIAKSEPPSPWAKEMYSASNLGMYNQVVIIPRTNKFMLAEVSRSKLEPLEPEMLQYFGVFYDTGTGIYDPPPQALHL